MDFDFDSPRNGRQIVNEAFEAFYGNSVRTGYRFSRIDRSKWTRLDYALERYDGYLSEYNTVSFQGDIDRGILQEGLVLSYPVKKVMDEIRKYMESDGNIIEALAESESVIKILVTKGFTGNVKESLKSLTDLCGWHLTGSGEYSKGLDVIYYESKFPADITDSIYLKYKKLYHITPARNFRSIEKKGLIPRSYNKRSDYPDRVYFLKTDNVAEYESLAKSSNPDIHEWSLLEIDISKEPVTGRRYRFYNDPFMNNAVFTYDNIHPGLVTLKRTFRV